MLKIFLLLRISTWWWWWWQQWGYLGIYKFLEREGCVGGCKVKAVAWAGAGAGGAEATTPLSPDAVECAGTCASAEASLNLATRSWRRQVGSGWSGYGLQLINVVMRSLLIWRRNSTSRESLKTSNRIWFSLNHDCEVCSLSTFYSGRAGWGWKASNHLWSGTRLFWDSRPCWLLIPLSRRQCGEGGHYSAHLGSWQNYIFGLWWKLFDPFVKQSPTHPKRVWRQLIEPIPQKGKEVGPISPIWWMFKY